MSLVNKFNYFKEFTTRVTSLAKISQGRFYEPKLQSELKNFGVLPSHANIKQVRDQLNQLRL